jgi:hypothetical protein
LHEPHLQAEPRAGKGRQIKAGRGGNGSRWRRQLPICIQHNITIMPQPALLEKMQDQGACHTYYVCCASLVKVNLPQIVQVQLPLPAQLQRHHTAAWAQLGYMTGPATKLLGDQAAASISAAPTCTH